MFFDKIDYIFRENGSFKMFKTFIAIFLAFTLSVSTVGCAASGPSMLHKPKTSLNQNPGNPSKKVIAIDDALNFANGGEVEVSDILIAGGLLLVGSFLLVLVFLGSSGGTSGGQNGGM